MFIFKNGFLQVQCCVCFLRIAVLRSPLMFIGLVSPTRAHISKQPRDIHIPLIKEASVELSDE